MNDRYTALLRREPATTLLAMLVSALLMWPLVLALVDSPLLEHVGDAASYADLEELVAAADASAAAREATAAFLAEHDDGPPARWAVVVFLQYLKDLHAWEGDRAAFLQAMAETPNAAGLLAPSAHPTRPAWPEDSRIFRWCGWGLQPWGSLLSILLVVGWALLSAELSCLADRLWAQRPWQKHHRANPVG